MLVIFLMYGVKFLYLEKNYVFVKIKCNLVGIFWPRAKIFYFLFDKNSFKKPFFATGEKM